MRDKIKTRKGFIQIPLLIVIIVSFVAVSVVTTGIVLYKQGESASFTANISEVFKKAQELVNIDSKRETEPQGLPVEGEREVVQESSEAEKEIKKLEGIIKNQQAQIDKLLNRSPEIREIIKEVPVEKIVYKEICSCPQTQKEELQRRAEQWISPVSAVASDYTVWGDTWYTGSPEFAIDGNNITAWTLNSMGEITFDLGNTKMIKGIEAYWEGHVTTGNTVNVFVNDIQVIYNEKFGATSNERYFNPVRGRYIKYQTVPLPHNVYLQVATWSEIAEFKVLVESE